jgi:hypothetical protein
MGHPEMHADCTFREPFERGPTLGKERQGWGILRCTRTARFENHSSGIPPLAKNAKDGAPCLHLTFDCCIWRFLPAGELHIAGRIEVAAAPESLV